MNEQSRLDLIEQYLAAYNGFDIDGMMAPLHHDVEFQNLSEGTVTVSAAGKKELRKLAEQSKNLFKSRTQTILNVEDKDDRVSVDIRFEAVVAMDLPNGLKAGQTLLLQGRSEFTFRDDKIVRIVDIN